MPWRTDPCKLQIEGLRVLPIAQGTHRTPAPFILLHGFHLLEALQALGATATCGPGAQHEWDLLGEPGGPAPLGWAGCHWPWGCGISGWRRWARRCPVTLCVGICGAAGWALVRQMWGRGGWRGAGSGGETETERTGGPGGPWRVWADESPGHSGGRLRVGTGPQAVEQLRAQARAGRQERSRQQACAPQARRARRTPLPNPSTQAPPNTPPSSVPPARGQG